MGQVDLKACTLTVGQSKIESGTGRLLPLNGRAIAMLSFEQACPRSTNPVISCSLQNATGHLAMERRLYTTAMRANLSVAGRNPGNRRRFVLLSPVASTTCGTPVVR